MVNIKHLISMYSFSHGLITAGVMFVFSGIGFYFALFAGGISVYHWWNREYKARKKDGTPQFKYWSMDSKMDAVTPTLTFIAMVAYLL